MKKVCYVSLIGRPNVGKSTLINGILDYELTIVSNLAQTTRDNIRGIYNDNDSQIIFIDTPGIHKPEQLLSEKLNQKSYDAIENTDVVLFLSPADEELGRGDEFIINKIKELEIQNKIAIITKVDLIKEHQILDQKAAKLKELGFQVVLGVGKNLKQSYKDLIEEIKKYAYESETIYEEDQIGDISLRFMAKEIIRQQAIENLYEEVPHSIAIVIDDFKESEEEPIVINATILVKSESQKGIVIGKGGSKIKVISMNARKKMSELFNQPTNLFLKVKVDNDWVNKEQKIKKYGY
ncbi:GTPase Era [Mycoplasma enhydrae]|uniref:GTPase Era n=1 Tax=Mycoplasma enhydrae TaxID=2499220 RepID=UPI0021E7FAC8|nr:GTPase Era [Mycoplasma enhydrae]MCV3733775.1 GTPase Era [Mycoplasma enhydrae]MCV3753530.1 GTPase Era [Mycoplasma enhydrae]